MRTALLVTILCLPLALASGCGRSKGDRVTVYPVTGKVLVNGQPAEGVNVIYYAEGSAPEGIRMPVPADVTDTNGVYELTSYVQGDGAPAGSYKVAAVWDEKPPANFSGVFEPKDRLQGRYASPDKSTLKAEVPEGGGEIPAFELK